VLVTLPIREVLPATPRAVVARLDLGTLSFPYLAGQAILIASHGYEPRRPYSIASAPEDSAREHDLELLVGVESDGRPGPHLELTPGALVDVEGPLGRFTFPDEPRERRFLFVAGGTGISPLRAMMRHALRIPHERIGLLYSARTPEEFAFESEFRALAAEGRIEFRQTVTRDVAPGQWEGTRGRIGRSDLEPLVHAERTLCFICGPQMLVQGVVASLGELGVRRERIRTEEWG
jgi:ferredoxin-NADP reductase